MLWKAARQYNKHWQLNTGFSLIQASAWYFTKYYLNTQQILNTMFLEQPNRVTVSKITIRHKTTFFSEILVKHWMKCFWNVSQTVDKILFTQTHTSDGGYIQTCQMLDEILLKYSFNIKWNIQTAINIRWNLIQHPPEWVFSILPYHTARGSGNHVLVHDCHSSHLAVGSTTKTKQSITRWRIS